MVHVYLYLNNKLNFIDETLHCVQNVCVVFCTDDDFNGAG